MVVASTLQSQLGQSSLGARFVAAGLVAMRLIMSHLRSISAMENIRRTVLFASFWLRRCAILTLQRVASQASPPVFAARSRQARHT